MRHETSMEEVELTVVRHGQAGHRSPTIDKLTARHQNSPLSRQLVRRNLADVNPTPLPEGSFAPTIVDLLRQRAAYRPHDRAFTFLVDGENEELNVYVCRT